MSLSQRFAKLTKGAPAGGVGGSRKQRQDAQKSTGAAKRGNVMASNRGLTISAEGRKNGKKKGVKVGKSVVTSVKSGRKGNNNGKGGKGGKGGKSGKGGKGGDENAPDDPAALDKAMDTYWFKAGKGPNPEEAALDRQMEAYMKSKPEAAAEAAAASSPAEA